MVWWIIQEFLFRNGILEIFLTLCNFQSWKVNFRTEVRLRTANTQITTLWSKEVDIAKSIDELMTLRSIMGRDFPDFDMLDAVIASALKKLLNTQSNFRQRASVEEQRAQKHDRFLRGRQIVYMIYEYFRAARAYEAVQWLLTLFAISLQNDDVQHFAVRRDLALLPVSEMPSDTILERLYKSKLQNSVQLQTVLALYDQETARSKEPNNQQSKTALKLHFHLMMWTRNFRVRNDVVERGSVSRKGKKAYVEMKVGEWRVFSVDRTWTMFQRRLLQFQSWSKSPWKQWQKSETKGRSSSPASHSKAKQTDGEGQKSSVSSNKQESSLEKEWKKFHACSKSAKIPSCKLWHPPVCLNYMSEKRCVHGDKCHVRHVEAERMPGKKSMKMVQTDHLLCWKSLYNWVVYLKLLIRENSTWTKKIGIKAVQEHLAQNKEKKSGKKGSIARDHPKVCA